MLLRTVSSSQWGLTAKYRLRLNRRTLIERSEPGTDNGNLIATIKSFTSRYYSCLSLLHLRPELLFNEPYQCPVGTGNLFSLF